jgi:hypothetical protein
MKTKLKFLVAIAGLGDPDCAALEKKYAAMRTWFEAKRRSENFIDARLPKRSGWTCSSRKLRSD